MSFKKNLTKFMHVQGLQFCLGIGLALFVFNTYAADRVLIMAISEYKQGGQVVLALPGVSFDISNAKKIAAKLGFDNRNVTVLQDDDLRLDNFIGNFQKFTQSVNNSDRVFVYFTGHGARVADQNKCVEGLIPSDSRGDLSKSNIISTDVVLDLLSSLKNKAREVTTLFDTCHAGGVIKANSRTLSAAARNSSEWVVKGVTHAAFVNPIACEVQTNYLTRGVEKVKNTAGFNEAHKNYTYIAAAKDTEGAIASSKGSVATNVILGCLNDGVSVSGTGSATVQDLLTCAQQEVNKQMPKIKAHNSNWLGMTLTAQGNTDRPLWGISTKLTAQHLHQPQNNSSITLPKTEKFSKALMAIRQLEADADKRWGLQVNNIPKELPLGASFKIPYSAAQGGYFYLFGASSDGLQAEMIYPPPNELRQRLSRVGNVGGDRPHGSGADAYVTIKPPLSVNHFLLIVSSVPKDFPKSLQGMMRIDELVRSVRGSARTASVTEEMSSSNANPLVNTYGAVTFMVKGVQ
jgi:Caspase domain